MGKNKENQQQGSGNLAILSKVDKLRELIGSTVGSKISLPQLVVVGDQSSGKSSVLENLTGFAFPRAAELCTRYATQITCRREPVEGVSISIIPNSDAIPSEQTRLRKFHRTCDELSTAILAQLFTDANKYMGIKSHADATGRDGSLPAFSQHILKIEKTGPDEEHFTVIDVPGIFRHETEGLTTEGDIELVKNMVKSYMQEERTIILAIMPSNVDPATQEILKLAKQADPSMKRTMAVLTKPDLAIEPAMQQIAIDHVTGKRGELTLGYYIVKNRGPSDNAMTLKDGQAMEQLFFQKAPWSGLGSTDRAGIECLKARVRELLVDLIKKEFPKLKTDIAQELQNLGTQLSKMGPSRNNEQAQRAYLCKISENFQSLVRDALTANYGRNNILSSRHDLRLITRIVEENEWYANEMMAHGHTRPFAKIDGKNGTAEEGRSPTRTFKPHFKPEECPDIQDILQEANMKYSESDDEDDQDDQDEGDLPSIGTLYLNDKDDVIDITPYIIDDKGDIMSYIEDVYKSSRGQELGTFGVTLLGTLFKEQSKNWSSITLRHIARIICHVHTFISGAVRDLCPEPSVRQELWDGYLLDELLKSYHQALDHAKFLLEIEREHIPLTLDRDFNENLQRAQHERLTQAIEAVATVKTERDGREVLNIHRQQLKGLANDQANLTHTCEHIHDVLSSYYNVSLDRFVDIVYQQAINYHLLSGKHSPLNIFNTEMVLSLNEEQLDIIAGEDSLTKRVREKLDREITSLEEAIKVLKGSR
ncbi:P-loop containing nucleoside triphosphate hydrolase protein [Nemania sp. FL0916]|nr:P-loop containing nucleoside triphosphate hydrolase protein [Nemania sp. FL0916]